MGVILNISMSTLPMESYYFLEWHTEFGYDNTHQGRDESHKDKTSSFLLQNGANRDHFVVACNFLQALANNE